RASAMPTAADVPSPRPEHESEPDHDCGLHQQRPGPKPYGDVLARGRGTPKRPRPKPRGDVLLRERGTPMTDRSPLSGLLVADFSRVLAGPLATMMMADLGATVIKVERPGEGDDTRRWGPPWTPRSSSYFEGVNRGKHSIALDLTDPADLEIATELVRRADVLVENFRPGVL